MYCRQTGEGGGVCQYIVRIAVFTPGLINIHYHRFLVGLESNFLYSFHCAF